MDVVAWITARGGFARVSTLRRAGVSDRRLGALVRQGLLSRPRRGIYSTRSSIDPEYIAVAVGGRLTGVSALHTWSAWLLEKPTVLHVSVASHATAVKPRPGMRVHWDDARGGTLSRTTVAEALVRAALDEPLDVVVPLFDWAHFSGRLDLFRFEELLLRLPSDLQVLREWVDPRSQSILESVARMNCLRRGWRVRSQVGVGDLGAIDLVVEDCVALELDGREFHESTFHADRAKDLDITLEGRHAIRVDAPLLHRSWPRIEAAIERALFERGRDVNNVGTRPPTTPEHRARRAFSLNSSEVVDRARRE